VPAQARNVAAQTQRVRGNLQCVGAETHCVRRRLQRVSGQARSVGVTCPGVANKVTERVVVRAARAGLREQRWALRSWRAATGVRRGYLRDTGCRCARAA